MKTEPQRLRMNGILHSYGITYTLISSQGNGVHNRCITFIPPPTPCTIKQTLINWLPPSPPSCHITLWWIDRNHSKFRLHIFALCRKLLIKEFDSNNFPEEKSWEKIGLFFWFAQTAVPTQCLSSMVHTKCLSNSPTVNISITTINTLINSILFRFLFINSTIRNQWNNLTLTVWIYQFWIFTNHNVNK